VTSTVTVKIDSKDPDLARVRELARSARGGKLIAFPTETVYGVGGPMKSPGLYEKLVQLKGRDENKPFSFHIGEWEMIDSLGITRTPVFRYLTRLFWPGPVTLIVPDKNGNKTGVRFPSNRVARAFINATGEPFIATSANKSGEPSPRTAADVLNQLGDHIDYVIDGGTTEFKEDSTVLDLTQHPPAILRKGANVQEVEKALEKIRIGKYPRKRILLVCTGNSCRSPMAYGWVVSELKHKGMIDEIEVTSAGIGARVGAPPTSEAIFVMKNREIDISEHRSRPCTREDVIESDLILAMSPEHMTFINGLLPSAKDKIVVLDVPDPIGLGMKTYEDCAALIDKKLKELWSKIIA